MFCKKESFFHVISKPYLGEDAKAIVELSLASSAHIGNRARHLPKKMRACFLSKWNEQERLVGMLRHSYDNCCANCFQLHFSLILILWRWAEWKTHLSWKDVAHGVAQVGVPVDPLLLRVADVVGHRLIPVPTAHHSLTPIFWWFRFNWEHIWSYQANFLSRNRSVKYICTPSSRKFVSSPVTQGVMPKLFLFNFWEIFVFLFENKSICRRTFRGSAKVKSICMPSSRKFVNSARKQLSRSTSTTSTLLNIFGAIFQICSTNSKHLVN